jgi:hypothetical protein
MERQYPDPLPLAQELPVFPDGKQVSHAELAFAVLDDAFPKAMAQAGLPSRFKGPLNDQILATKVFDFTHSYLAYRTGDTGFASPYPKEKAAFQKRLDIEAGDVVKAAAAVDRDGEACIRLGMHCVDNVLRKKFGTIAIVGMKPGRRLTGLSSSDL